MNAPLADSPLTLDEVLHARESRAGRQEAWRARHGVPLVSVTLVSPGPVKDGPRWRLAMREAIVALDSVLTRHQWRVVDRECLWLRTGPEALYAVETDVISLKRAMVELEDRHPLGRLWDLDVIAEQGPVSRRAFGIAPRRCLVCEESAKACARAQRHPISTLLASIERIIDASA